MTKFIHVSILIPNLQLHCYNKTKMRIFFTFFTVLLANYLLGQVVQFSEQPSLALATPSSLELQWKMENSVDSPTIWWGKSPDQLVHSQVIDNHSTQVLIPDLNPATIYYFKVQYDKNGASYFSETKPFITSSLSSGEMRVFFNYSVDASYSNGASPETTTSTALETEMIQFILAAKKTIDICMYNVNRDGYINALKQAVANGVRVRYIAEAERTNSSLHNNTLNFPVLYADGSGIMHDKFLIIDKDSTETTQVVTGAYNFTNSNLYQGYNNMISIQDQSLAEIYTLEFEEMWGGSGDQPNLALSKIGDLKTDNTPHILYINGSKVESYFSPSDQTSSHIVDAINTADQDLRFGLLAFTNDEIESAVLNTTVPVKGLIEEQYNGTITAQFQANGQDVYDFEESGHFLHHKYGLIDVVAANSDPIVITGSHNWTYSAENYNDENTLIIHNADIANIYLQEFEARWKTIVAIDEINGIPKLKIFPNPASNTLFLQNNTVLEQTVSITDCLGNQMNAFSLRPDESFAADIQHFPQGIYYVTIQSNSGYMATKKLVVYR